MASLLVDSNIVIYACASDGNAIRSFLRCYDLQVSQITRLETLGYHRLQLADRQALRSFFGGCVVLPIDESVINEAIHLRERNKMNLADAIIAATALQQHLPLCTRNTSDFQHIHALQVVNPYA